MKKIKKETQNMKEGYIEIDASKCLSCKTCEIECGLAHSELKGARDLGTSTCHPRISVEKMKNVSMPLQCRHCEDAPCVKICPTGAIIKTKKEGPVIIDVNLCIGCKRCLLICPFGVISINHLSRASLKCDLCISRLKEDTLPACVSGCPTKAIKFLTIDNYNKEKRKKVIRELNKEGQV